MDFGRLAAKGWTVDGKRMIFRAGAAKELVLEERDPQTVWLWIHGEGDKRCLGLTPGDKLDQLIDAIAGMQSELSLQSYLGHYLTLQGVCDEVAIIAWEQFEARPASSTAAFGSGTTKKKW